MIVAGLLLLILGLWFRREGDSLPPDTPTLREYWRWVVRKYLPQRGKVEDGYDSRMLRFARYGIHAGLAARVLSTPLLLAGVMLVAVGVWGLTVGTGT